MSKLTSKHRDDLPSSAFALPAERKFPIFDKNHARNALARASAFASPPQKKAIDAKVHKRFPGIK